MLRISSVCLKLFIVHEDGITHKKKIGLLKNFWIAMLPCYQGFSISGQNTYVRRQKTEDRRHTKFQRCLLLLSINHNKETIMQIKQSVNDYQ